MQIIKYTNNEEVTGSKDIYEITLSMTSDEVLNDFLVKYPCFKDSDSSFETVLVKDSSKSKNSIEVIRSYSSFGHRSMNSSQNTYELLKAMGDKKQ